MKMLIRGVVMLSLLLPTWVIGQNNCGVEHIASYNGTNKSPEDSRFGGAFTPRGKMRMLIICAGFTNDANTTSGANDFWPNDDGSGSGAGNSLPNYDDVLYPDYTGFQQSNTDNSLSNFYYQMSEHSSSPFQLVYDVFPVRVNVEVTPADMALLASQGKHAVYRALTKKVMDKIQAEYVDLYDWSRVDQRKNNPNYEEDNSFPAAADGIVDYALISWRFDDANDPIGTTGLAGVSANGIASTNINYEFTKGNGDKYKIQSSSGFSLYTGMHDASFQKEYFLHELAHQFYGCPHNFAANNTHGAHFTTNYGWGMLTEDLKQIYCANSFERWYVGWIEIKNDLKGTVAENGTYVLGDYVTTGDAIRIEIPHTGGNQYLWLENHQGVDATFDNRLRYYGTGANGFTAAPRGLLAFKEQSRSTRIHTNVPGAFSNPNGMQVLSAAGRHDYVSVNNSVVSASHYFNAGTVELTKKKPNPLSGTTLTTKTRIDYDGSGPDGNITYNAGGNGGYNESIKPLILDGNNIFDILGTNIGFQPGEKIGLGEKAVVTNYQTYNKNDDKVSPIYLNGISIEVTSVNSSTHEMTLEIKFNDTEVGEDTRYTGEIIVQDVPGAALDLDLNVGNGVILEIDKSETANKRLELGTGSGDFVRPTVMTISDGAYMHMEPLSEVKVMNGSTLKLNANSTLEVHDNSVLTVQAGSKLIVENDAQILVHHDGLIVIEEGAELILKNSNVLKGLRIGQNSTVYQSAELRVYGKLKVEDNAVLTNGGDGFISFYDNGNMEFGANTTMELTGKGRNDEVLHVGTDVQLRLDANQTRILDCKIGFHDGAELILNQYNRAVNIDETYSFNNVTFAPDNHNFKNNKVKGYALGGLEIWHSSFYEMGAGLELYSCQDAINIYNTSFDECEKGIYAIGSFAMNFTESNFTNCSTGIESHSGTELNFDECYLGYNTIGLHLLNTFYTYMDNHTVVHGNDHGILGGYSHVFLRGRTEFTYNKIGVELNGNYFNNSLLSMGDNYSCAWMLNNNLAIKGRDLYLNIDAVSNVPYNCQDCKPIPNRFEVAEVNGQIASLCYTLTAPQEIMARGNYWDIGNPNPRLRARVCTSTGGNGGGDPDRVEVNMDRKIQAKAADDGLGNVYYVPVDYKLGQCFRRPEFGCGCPSNPGEEHKIRKPDVRDILYGVCSDLKVSDGMGMKDKFQSSYLDFSSKQYNLAMPELDKVARISYKDPNNKLDMRCEHLIRIAEILSSKYDSPFIDVAKQGEEGQEAGLEKAKLPITIESGSHISTIGLSIQDKSQLSKDEANANNSLVVYNMLGNKVVEMFNVSSDGAKINMTGAPSGAYVVKYFDGVNISSSRFIIQK